MPKLDFNFDIPSNLNVWNLTASSEWKISKEELLKTKEKEKDESFMERKKHHLANKLKDLETVSDDEENETEPEDQDVLSDKEIDIADDNDDFLDLQAYEDYEMDDEENELDSTFARKRNMESYAKKRAFPKKHEHWADSDEKREMEIARVKDLCRQNDRQTEANRKSKELRRLKKLENLVRIKENKKRERKQYKRMIEKRKNEIAYRKMENMEKVLMQLCERQQQQQQEHQKTVKQKPANHDRESESDNSSSEGDWKQCKEKRSSEKERKDSRKPTKKKGGTNSTLEDFIRSIK